MNPILIILAAGYGYLSGNPKARKQFFSAISNAAGKGIDALNSWGGEPNEPDISDTHNELIQLEEQEG